MVRVRVRDRVRLRLRVRARGRRRAQTCARLAVEVVCAMVARPVVDRALVGEAVAQHGERAKAEARLVAAVRPQPVRPTGDAEATNRPQCSGPQERGGLARRDHTDARQSEQVARRDVNGHRPTNVFHGPRRQPLLLCVRHLFTADRVTL